MTLGGHKPRVYVLHAPRWGYAPDYLRAMHREHGLRAVCWFPDEGLRREAERGLPMLRSDMVEATYDSIGIAEFAALLADRYEVVAVVPCHEDDLAFVASLVEALGLPWNRPEVLRRFRDKAAQKEFLLAADADVRVAAGRRLAGVEDLLDGELPERFVLKPRGGAGNLAIGIFDRTARDAAEQHIRSNPGHQWLLEEFVAGSEFNVNGQVRPDGRVDVLTVFEYQRRALNGHPAVYDMATQLASTHESFAPILDYTQRLMRATGLRGCPFHLELKLDEHGPCMFDLAARFGGSSHAYWMTRSHPGRPDAFTVAAHDLLGPNEVAAGPVDWEAHDDRRCIVIYGMSTESTWIRRLDGREEVEQLPGFLGWARQPVRVGDHLGPTRELLQAPYAVACALGPATDPVGLAAHIRSLIRWNAARPTVSDLVRFAARRAENLLRRVRRRALSVRRAAARLLSRSAPCRP